MSALGEYYDILAATGAHPLNGDVWLKYRQQTGELLDKARRADIYRILNQTQKLDDDCWVKAWVYKTLPLMYKKHKPLRSEILNMMGDNYAKSNLALFYKNITQIILVEKESKRIEQCFGLIEKFLKSDENTSDTLQSAYFQFSRMKDLSDDKKQKIKFLIELGLQSKSNDAKSLEEAQFALESISNERISRYMTHIVLGRRVKATAEYPHKWQDVDQIEADQTCLVVFPGNSVDSRKKANYYLSSIERLMKYAEIKNVDHLYATVNLLGGYFDADHAVKISFQKRRCLAQEQIPENIDEEHIEPHYINEIYQKIFKPRLQNLSKQRLTCQDAAKNINRVVIFAHCFGGYTLLKLEEKLEQEMKQLKYDVHERRHILNNLFCVAYEPYAPLDAFKSKIVSFVSLKDDVIKSYNHFEDYMRSADRVKKINPAYFHGKKGEVVLVRQIRKTEGEHTQLTFDVDCPDLTEDGAILTTLMANTLVNAICFSSQNIEKKDIRTLMTGNNALLKKLFDQMKKEGDALWQDMKDNLKQELPLRRFYGCER